MFTVDGMTWDIPCTIERTAEIRASDISGMLLNRMYFNDVLGTYMQYTVSIAVPFSEVNTYVTLYETLTNPVESHTFVLPYNKTNINLIAMVDMVSDKYIRMPNDGKYWRGTQFTVTSIYPSKQLTLGEVIARGMPSPPDFIPPNVGDTYTYTSGGWVPVIYDDADNKYY